MKLTKKGEYALRALIDLGIAREAGRPVIQISELAEHERIPIKFLEQILVELKAAGYLDSKRGQQGGYWLKAPMERIRMGDIVRRIEGPLAPIGCASQGAYVPCSCPDEEHCGLRMLMVDVRNAIAGVLDGFTLADVVEVTLRKIRRDGLAVPFALAVETLKR